jgi:hypothetical protein
MKRREAMQLLERTARKQAAGDSVLEEVLLAHLRYTYRPNDHKPHVDEPKVVGEVKLWCVGCNASHEFYIGTDGKGRRFNYSVGEGELDEDGLPELVESPVHEVAEFGGYYGHR